MLTKPHVVDDLPQCTEHCVIVDQLASLDEKVALNNAMLMALCRHWRVTVPSTGDIEVISKRFSARGPSWAVVTVLVVTALVGLVLRFNSFIFRR